MKMNKGGKIMKIEEYHSDDDWTRVEIIDEIIIGEEW